MSSTRTDSAREPRRWPLGSARRTYAAVHRLLLAFLGEHATVEDTAVGEHAVAEAVKFAGRNSLRDP